MLQKYTCNKEEQSNARYTKADKPEQSFLSKNGNRGDSNRYLEHSNSPGKNRMMLQVNM